MTGKSSIAASVRGALLSGAGMKLLVDAFEPRVVDVRVNLRGANAGMAKHFLNLA